MQKRKVKSNQKIQRKGKRSRVECKIERKIRREILKNSRKTKTEGKVRQGNEKFFKSESKQLQNRRRKQNRKELTQIISKEIQAERNVKGKRKNVVNKKTEIQKKKKRKEYQNQIPQQKSIYLTPENQGSVFRIYKVKKLNLFNIGAAGRGINIIDKIEIVSNICQLTFVLWKVSKFNTLRKYRI